MHRVLTVRGATEGRREVLATPRKFPSRELGAAFPESALKVEKFSLRRGDARLDRFIVPLRANEASFESEGKRDSQDADRGHVESAFDLSLLSNDKMTSGHWRVEMTMRDRDSNRIA